ncbi:MAG TPA: DNA alkylation repair protein [Polyangiaceae bacterium]|nr:DNA alkylation repair protein [Polyangiaceae bacterium]
MDAGSARPAQPERLAKAALAFFRKRFRAEGDQSRAAGAKAYLKSQLRFYGVANPGVRAAASDYLRERPLQNAREVVAVCRALYATREHELWSAAIAILEKRRKLLEPSHLPWLVQLVRRSAGWAYVDWIATNVVPAPLARAPSPAAVVLGWAKDRDFWVRRTALLCQLRDLRHGAGDFELFEQIAVPMLGEKEFFIRKAIGWVLRDVSHKRPELVRAFVARHGEQMSGLTRREASKYLGLARR